MWRDGHRENPPNRYYSTGFEHLRIVYSWQTGASSHSRFVSGTGICNREADTQWFAQIVCSRGCTHICNWKSRRSSSSAAQWNLDHSQQGDPWHEVRFSKQLRSHVTLDHQSCSWSWFNWRCSGALCTTFWFALELDVGDLPWHMECSQECSKAMGVERSFENISVQHSLDWKGLSWIGLDSLGMEWNGSDWVKKGETLMS